MRSNGAGAAAAQKNAQAVWCGWRANPVPSGNKNKEKKKKKNYNGFFKKGNAEGRKGSNTSVPTPHAHTFWRSRGSRYTSGGRCGEAAEATSSRERNQRRRVEFRAPDKPVVPQKGQTYYFPETRLRKRDGGMAACGMVLSGLWAEVAEAPTSRHAPKARAMAGRRRAHNISMGRASVPTACNAPRRGLKQESVDSATRMWEEDH
ncbi:hypothetical protein C8F04DRAFT_1202043 [Mycena alexandri]|uniref:Uncharacterized protein n=1 Tax=Mycena alexandri TaxID=1745969 RepID=A0AAD6RW61_9AGAR|nr:hypothetical protein C8F04DRAFT_1202043 [Mycena alexandri]